MVFFEKLIALRIKKKTWEEVKAAVKENCAVYDTESHFVRCAINRELERLRG